MDFSGKATGRFWKLGAQSQELGVADHRLLTSDLCIRRVTFRRSMTARSRVQCQITDC